MNLRFRRFRFALVGAAVLAAALTTAVALLPEGGASASLRHADQVFQKTADAKTTTPIKHVVVIFDENVSFDHYFATYPNTANTDGEPFYATPGTPSVNGLTGGLLTANPNG